MTEQRFPYGAYYGEMQASTATSARASVEGIPAIRDILLFLLVFESGQVQEPDTSCWHFISSGDGKRDLCRKLALSVCPCCAFPMCGEHQSDRSASFPDETGVWSEEKVLCANCCLLTQEQRYTLHAFRLAMND